MMHRFSSLQFENIQAQLEVEIENLSYQIERSTTHNRGVRRTSEDREEKDRIDAFRTSKINVTLSNVVVKRYF